MPRKDLINLSFGRLTVTGMSGKDRHGHYQWTCKCECGSSIVTRSGSLLSGNTRSCGCLQKEVTAEIGKKPSNVKHGMTGTTEHHIWQSMKDRCYNRASREFQYYGERGITMCDEWKESFEAFYRDMGPRPSADHTIDREDNEVGYLKSNCRWATWEEQANNRRNNVYYEFDGEKRTLAQWCRELCIDYGKMYYLLNKGMGFEDAADHAIRGEIEQR